MISFGFISKATVLNEVKHFQESSDVLICLINSLLTCRYSINSNIKLRQSLQESESENICVFGQ